MEKTSQAVEATSNSQEVVSQDRSRRKPKRRPLVLKTKKSLAIMAKQRGPDAKKKKIMGTSRRSSSAAPSGNSQPIRSNYNVSAGWRNCIISKGKPRDVAKGVWEFGKMLGIENKGNEEVLINRLEGMEERDRAAARGQGVEGGVG